MADMFKYPVFFECPDLQEERMKKIENYFQIKRRSGGGECGPLRRIDSSICIVAFKDQRDQQRVLQKSQHVVDDLVFTVRDNLEPGSSSPVRVDSASVQDIDVIKPEEVVRRRVHESSPKRIIILGKTGSGKSSLANTILEEKIFPTDHTSNSGTGRCQVETRSVHRRNITLIDTPGYFDTVISEEELKPEVVRCITECSPGPHAFLIVLKVERFTEQEEAVVTKICQCFSEDALKHAVIIFTHGDQLREGMKIEEFVSGNKKLSDLVKKCGGRCHVIDNKYWKNNEEDDYRNNRVQVEKLLDTIDKMVMENNGGFYTNEMLQETERQIQKEVKHIQQTHGHLTEEQIKSQAKVEVNKKFLIRLAGIATGTVVGALCGLAVTVGLMITALNPMLRLSKSLKTGLTMAAVAAGAPGAAGGAGAAEAAGAAGGAVGLSPAGVAIGVAGTGMAIGGVMGGVIGNQASEGAETPWEASKNAAAEVVKAAGEVFRATAEVIKAAEKGFNNVISTSESSSSKYNAKE